MRGSVYYQTAELTKCIFVEGAKKEERIDSNHPYSGCVASYKTMETYRSVWNNFGHYLKEHWNLKDFEQITEEHVEAYFAYKIEYYPTKQYLEKLSSAIGKLEIALTRYTKKKYGTPLHYEFGVRQLKLTHARSLQQVANGYHNRVYKEPQKLIKSLLNPLHRIAATIQLQGGARSEAVTFIKSNQLKKYKDDGITGSKVGVIETREKGGKVGDILISPDLYKELERHIALYGRFKISYAAYADDIRQACKRLSISPEGSHGLRWTFAQERVRAYQKAGYSYEEALQGVSYEMKHFRADITEHYIG